MCKVIVPAFSHYARIRSDTVRAPGGEKAHRVLSVFMCIRIAIHTGYDWGCAHDGYRGAGVGVGWSQEGPGSEVDGTCS